MSSAMSMFCTAVDCVRNSLCVEINEFLETIGARRCSEADTPSYADLPLLASHEKHQFKLNGSRIGWVDLVQRKDKLLQFVINFQYPKRRWFSPCSNDWKQLTTEAANLFGPGYPIGMAGKTCLHFHDQNFKLLITNYDAKKYNFIEIKMAKDRFCY